MIVVMSEANDDMLPFSNRKVSSAWKTEDGSRHVKLFLSPSHVTAGRQERGGYSGQAAVFSFKVVCIRGERTTKRERRNELGVVDIAHCCSKLSAIQRSPRTRISMILLALSCTCRMTLLISFKSNKLL
eukprot:765102-Hanusia_phi.AAC.2